MAKIKKYDADYFENGIETGKSCYTNYRWIPELTIRMAHHIVRHLNIAEGHKILDYGCAKGFTVKAFRILDIDAYGCDISQYAIDNVDTDVRHYCKLIKSAGNVIPFKFKFDWIISKDVLEHLDDRSIDEFLKQSLRFTDKAFHVVPLGNSQGKYIVPDYQRDITHITAKDVAWWKNKFESCGWQVKTFSYNVKGIKDSWTMRYKRGNGFFILAKMATKKAKGDLNENI
jgi:SAM-dependent methyltransferase